MSYTHSLSRPAAALPSTALHFHAKDPGSALTHGIAFCAAVFSTPWLLVRASVRGINTAGLVSLSVFLLSMTLLYGASTVYHTLDVSPRVNQWLKRLDHMMIFVLIAGSYTPFCTLVLGGNAGRRLLVAVWGAALAGMVLKCRYVNCPKWFSSVLYIAMGWACVSQLPAIYAASSPAVFGWLLAGGLFYTVGGVIYALRWQAFGGRFRSFGTHELFHVFVMAGSLCHYIMLCCCVG